MARNHAFVDGNGRTSLVVTELFLALNGHSLLVGDEEVVLMWLAIADGSRDEFAITAWLAQHSAGT